MSKKGILCVVVTIGTLLVVLSLFSRHTLFSEVTGQVVENGTPTPEIEIEQYVSDGTKSYTKKVRTDSEGKFAFPAVTKNRGITGFLQDTGLSQFVANQELSAVVNGQKKTLWLTTKKTPEPNSETGGRLFDLLCDVSLEEDFRSKSYGVCDFTTRKSQ